MAQFAFIYYGEPQFSSEAEGKQHFERHKAWMGGLGDAIVNPGIPLGVPKTVSSSGVKDNDARHLTGMTIIEAENLDAAVEMVKGCPYLEHDNTTIDVAEVFQM